MKFLLEKPSEKSPALSPGQELRIGLADYCIDKLASLTGNVLRLLLSRRHSFRLPLKFCDYGDRRPNPSKGAKECKTSVAQRLRENKGGGGGKGGGGRGRRQRNTEKNKEQL